MSRRGTWRHCLTRLGALLPKVDGLADRLAEMRGELSEQRDGLRADLNGLPFVTKS